MRSNGTAKSRGTSCFNRGNVLDFTSTTAPSTPACSRHATLHSADHVSTGPIPSSLSNHDSTLADASVPLPVFSPSTQRSRDESPSWAQRSPQSPPGAAHNPAAVNKTTALRRLLIQRLPVSGIEPGSPSKLSGEKQVTKHAYKHDCRWAADFLSRTHCRAKKLHGLSGAVALDSLTATPRPPRHWRGDWRRSTMHPLAYYATPGSMQMWASSPASPSPETLSCLTSSSTPAYTMA